MDRTTDLSNLDQYTNMSLYNPINSTTGLECSYSEQRVQNVVEGNLKNYKAAVLSVAIPTRSIPLLLWEQYMPNGIDFRYTVTLAFYHGLTPIPANLPAYPALNDPIIMTVPCQYVPFTIGEGQNGIPAYVFLYNQILISINNAYESAYQQIVTNLTLVRGGNPTYTWLPTYPQYAPKMVFDTSLEKFFIKADYRMNTNSNDPEALVPNIKPFMQMSYNDGIDSFFYNFPGQSYVYGFNVGPEGRDTVIRIYDTGAQDCLIKANPLDNSTWFYQIYQQSSSKSLMSQVNKILVVSNMPFRYENFNAINTIGTTAQLNIIADFDVSITGFGPDDTTLLWTPQPNYKWMDILDANNFNYLDYTIYFATNDGRLTKLALFPGDSCSVKLVIERK